MRTSIVPRRGGRVFITLLTGLIVGGVVGGGAVYLFGGKRLGKGNVTEPSLAKADELNLVPADASAFIHIRVADAWKTDALAGVRELINAAGSEYINAFDAAFLPNPSTLDRATIVMLREPVKQPPPMKVEGPKDPLKGMPPPPKVPPKPTVPPMETVMILVFSSAFDTDTLGHGKILADATKKTSHGKDYWLSPRKNGKGEERNGKWVELEEYRAERAIYVVNDKTLVTGTGTAMELFLSRQGTSGPLSGPLKQAAEGARHVVAGVNLLEEGISDDIRSQLPTEAGPFMSPMFRAHAVSASMIVGDPARVEFRAFYRDDKIEKEAYAAFREAASGGWSGPGKPTMLASGVKGKGGKPGPHFIQDAVDVIPALSAVATLNILQKLIQDGELKEDGNDITISIKYATTGDAVVELLLMASGMTLPAEQSRRRLDREAALAPIITPGPPPKPPGPPNKDPMIAPKPKGPMPNKGNTASNPDEPKNDKP